MSGSKPRYISTGTMSYAPQIRGYAQDGPVFVKRHGEVVLVILSPKEYERLTQQPIPKE